MLAPVLVEAVPIPPIVDIAPTLIIPTQLLPSDEPQLAAPFQPHPIEPMPSYAQSKPKLYRLPRRFRRPVKNETHVIYLFVNLFRIRCALGFYRSTSVR